MILPPFWVPHAPFDLAWPQLQRLTQPARELRFDLHDNAISVAHARPDRIHGLALVGDRHVVNFGGAVAGMLNRDLPTWCRIGHRTATPLANATCEGSPGRSWSERHCRF